MKDQKDGLSEQKEENRQQKDSGETGGWNPHVKAILVGVTDYSALPNTPDLPLGRNDVDLLVKALIYGLHIHPFNIWTKMTDAGTISRASFLEGIRLFLSDISPEDTLIFYFSGHGRVSKGKHYLVFSDGAIETQSVIDLFAELQVEKRMLFLDCCMSGLFDLSPENERNWVEQLAGKGTAVFASSRSGESAGYAAEKKASVFTTFLWNAMTNRYYLEQGYMTLDRILELVYQESESWNEQHPDRPQHPVFRSNMTGTIRFRVANDRPYHQKKYIIEKEEYLVVDISPLHAQNAKRYVVKVILKNHITEEILICINREIIRCVRNLDIYKTQKEEERWGGHPADIVFTYFGHSREDVTLGNYECHTTWVARREDQGYWYRPKKDSKIIDGIYMQRNPAYGWLLQYTEENIGDALDLITQTNGLLKQIVAMGEELIRIRQEVLNGSEIDDEAKIRKICREVNSLYITMSELPIPPQELADWNQAAVNVAGDVEDLSRFLLKGIESTERMDAQIDDVIRRYHADLEVYAKRNQDVEPAEQ